MIDLILSGSPASLRERVLRRAFDETFRITRKKSHGAVSVTCVSDARMKQLNRIYRKKDATTDVLSFHVPTKTPQVGEKEWGDIFISPSFVGKEARRRKIDPTEEMLRVAVHGLLHLMGYDHANVRDEMRMFGLQERVIAKTLEAL